MWIAELLKANFTVLLDTLIKRPFVILTIVFLFSTVFFMNKMIDAQNEVIVIQSKNQSDRDSIQAIAFDRLYMLFQERQIRREEKATVDSMLREKIEKPITELKENVDRIN